MKLSNAEQQINRIERELDAKASTAEKPVKEGRSSEGELKQPITERCITKQVPR